MTSFPSIVPTAPSPTDGGGQLSGSGGGNGQLRLPEFEWYLGPMYKRYAAILAERERANTAQVVKKKVTYTVPPEPSHLKHTTPRMPVYTFSNASLVRPLISLEQVYICPPSQSPRKQRQHDTLDGSSRLGKKALTPR
eukprot:TRINITY_DN10950_c0_g1_i1.p1 TRINITY_DN10950_c0_g1~~TRINITY_DN10950_c0_g1_i1.p1  ORF type:complete len:138 (-),score=7.67 TRINITY_DN10950_c0_g1_i1:440-853(-)